MNRSKWAAFAAGVTLSGSRLISAGLLGIGLLGTGLASGGLIGCTAPDAPGARTPTAAPPGAAAPADGTDEAEVERRLQILADALPRAATVDQLRADLVPDLPTPADDPGGRLKAIADDPEAGADRRLAASTALGALADPARVLALRGWLNTAIKLPSPGAHRTSELAVRLLTTLHPPLARARGALAPIVSAALPPTSPGERTAWLGSMAEQPLDPVGPGDLPALIRLALSDQAASPRMAWLLMAPMDLPAVTEALLHLPAADLGEPRPGRTLTDWALALHVTTPGGLTRLKAAAAGTGRAADRATAVLTWIGDPAARAPAAKLLDRLAARHTANPEGAPPLDFDLGDFIEGAGRLAEGETAEGPLAMALARYGETGAPMGRRARALAGPAGVSADRDALLDRLAADPGDPRARRMVLPMLGSQDGPRIAALLARERWAIKGFFHAVRLTGQASADLLTPEVVAALEAVAADHPDPQTREWALGALARATGPLPPVVIAAAAKGSKAGVRTVVMRADDPWNALWTRITGEDDPVRRAAFEVLIAPRLLPFEPTPEQAARILEQVARHLTARPEEPWLFLRAARHYVEPARAARTPALEAGLARALRPYCVTTGPDGKPWWDALFTVASLTHADARALVADAVKSVPTAQGRMVMRERLGLPVDPSDPLPVDDTPPRLGGH